MESLFKLIEIYGVQLSAIGAVVTFIFSAYKFRVERNASHYWKEFESYHKLVKELVEPPPGNGGIYLDRQTAIIYELRFYRRHYHHTLRMLDGLKVKCDNLSSPQPRLITELELTIDYINKKLKQGQPEGPKNRRFALVFQPLLAALCFNLFTAMRHAR